MEPVRILEIIAFLDLLAAGLIVPQIPAQARSIGGNHLLVGAMGALYAGFQLVSSPLTGSLSDLKGRAAVLLLTLSVSGIAYTFLGFTTSIVLFLGLRAVLGITKHTQLQIQALAPDFVKDKNQLSEVYGRLKTLKYAGMALGPIIGGHIIETFPGNGFTIIAFLVGAIFAANCGLVRKLPQLEVDKKKEKNKDIIVSTLLNRVSTNFSESLEQFYKINWPKYWDIFSFKLLICMCFGIYINNYFFFLKIKYGVSSITTGYIISLFSVVGSLTSYFISYINNYYKNDKNYTERNLHVFIMLSLSLLGVTLSPTVLLYVACIIPLSVSSAVGSLVTNDVLLSKTDSEQRGTVMGVANNIRSFSGVISPLITGVVSQYVGVLYVVYVSIIFAVIGTYRAYIVRQQSLEAKNK